MDDKPHGIFYSIWYPKLENLINIRIFFKCSIVGTMLLSTFFTIAVSKGYVLVIMMLIFTSIIGIVRIIAGIRYDKTQYSSAGTDLEPATKGLPKEKKKKFYLCVFLYMPIGLIIGLSLVLLVINRIQNDQGESLTIGIVLSVCIPVLLFSAYSVWSYYRLLKSGNETHFD